MSDPTDGARERRAALLLLAVSTVISLAVLEAGLRIALGAPPVWRDPQEEYVADAETGFALRPEQDGYTIDAPVHVNSLGIRDREYDTEPAPGVVRVVALGDSQTFGVGIPGESTWPKQLERALAVAQPSVRFEVLNGGLPATATLNQAKLLPRLLDAYHPACVVLAVYVNDVIPVTIAVPFELGAQGDWRHRVGHLAKRSALFTTALRLWLTLRATPAQQAEAQHERSVLLDDGGSRVEAGWAQIEGSLAQIQHETRTRGACLVLLTMPRRDQVDGREPATTYHRRVAEVAARFGIPSVDPLPALRAVRDDDLVVPWDGHYNGVAQGVMARAVVPSLLEALTPAEASSARWSSREPLARTGADRRTADSPSGR